MQHSDLFASDVIDQLAELAHVPSEHRDRFRCKIDLIIREMTRAHATSGMRISSTKLAERLEQIGKGAEQLQKRLKMAEWPVRVIIDCGLNETGPTLYQHCVENLEVLRRAIQWSKKNVPRSKGRPAGIQTRFEALVWLLLSAARTYGGKLIIYKDAHAEGRWSGSLLKAVCLLKSILPRGFVPAGDLGNALDRIAKPFRH